ncbi:transcriptional repressor LexA [uncultured Tyzzerella sp.]|uniref:transcriptional repressor LexA n=1 Tax=uncultured Tyzzerella sp. TaxID=2321398 RepID=UPI002941D9F2|nr:transcriptional repressor LexA [uncultured Tyzzerella sp.]
MESLTEKQQLILDYIKTQVKLNGVVPSIREICKASGLSSTSSVHLHLETLEKKGYIRRKQAKTRNIEILEKNFYNNNFEELANIPILGNVSAGLPTLAVENIESYFPIPISYLKNNDAFMLKVFGDSMINAGIYDGDLVLVNKQSTANNRDIVIALIDDETTCKRFFIEDNNIILKPENDLYEPIKSNNVTILGKVIGLFRSF